MPGLAAGGEVLFWYQSLPGATSTRYGIGPKVTNFFGRGERSVYPFAWGSVGLVRTASKGFGI